MLINIYHIYAVLKYNLNIAFEIIAEDIAKIEPDLNRKSSRKINKCGLSNGTHA